MRRKNIFHECKNKIIGLGGIKYLLQGGIKRAGGGNHFAPNVEIEFTRIPHSMLSAWRFFTILRVLTNERLRKSIDWIGSGIPESQIRGTTVRTCTTNTNPLCNQPTDLPPTVPPTTPTIQIQALQITGSNWYRLLRYQEMLL